MPRVVLTPTAVQGLARCREFLAAKDSAAARRAAVTIRAALASLETFPESGRPVESEDPATDGMRELVIPFGVAGYVALYAVVGDRVVVLAVRHQRETGW